MGLLGKLGKAIFKVMKVFHLILKLLERDLEDHVESLFSSNITNLENPQFRHE